MYMRMKPERDGKYIDCHHNVAGVESIVRVLLKRQPTSTSQDAEGSDNEEILYCSSECTRSSVTAIKNPNGIQGLNFSRVLFIYYPFEGYQEIHYEYKDQESLDITWDVSLIASKSNEYTVYWKDKLVSSFPVIKTVYDCRVSLKFKPMILTADDDRSIIKYCKSINDKYRSDHEQLRIILRRISDTKGMEQEDNCIQLSIFIPVGVLCFLAVILITVMCVIVKRKTKVSRNVTDNPSYGDLESEESVNPFPSQWETYANVMERRYPDANSMGRLYATPLPKSQRKGQQKDMYVNSNATAAPVAEGLYSVVERCSAQEHAPRIQ
ncbi:hypothetical protein O3G_MSEX014920 [Manduca sexta]|nr:hypothetical protein O3G_MSEX014920 [Manduca sexta]